VESAWKSNLAESRIDMHYMKRKSQKVYMALEDDDLNFYWDEKEVELFDKLWKRRTNIMDIADALKRDPDEVMLLAIDRARKGFINKRKGGIVGRGSTK
jgi:hypothetical protein